MRIGVCFGNGLLVLLWRFWIVEMLLLDFYFGFRGMEWEGKGRDGEECLMQANDAPGEKYEWESCWWSCGRL